MFIVPITRMKGPAGIEEVSRAGMKTETGGKTDFSSILKEAVQEADKAVSKTREMDIRLASGEIDDLHTALIQAEQSAAAIEFTTQLTSKAVSAYNQIMGMQI